MMNLRTLIIPLFCGFVASCFIQSDSAVVTVSVPNSTAIENAPKAAVHTLEKLAGDICGKPVELDPRELKVEVVPDVLPQQIMVSATLHCSR